MVPSYSKFKIFCKENNLSEDKENELIIIAAAIVREEQQRTMEFLHRMMDGR